MPRPGFESIKIYADDYERAKSMKRELGLSVPGEHVPFADVIGAALEGWGKLPDRVRRQILSERSARREAAAGGSEAAVA